MDNQKFSRLNESTILDSASAPKIPSPLNGTVASNSAKPAAKPATAATKSKSSSTAASAVGAGVGAVVGAGAGAVLTGMRSDEPLQFEHVEDDDVVVAVEPEPATPEDNVTVEPVVEPVYDVHLAHGVNDDMSFAQAFSAARAEVGPGGTFHWHGQSYNTYTAEEWNSMSHDQQVAFGHAAVNVGPAPTYTPTNHSVAENNNHNGSGNNIAQNTTHPTSPEVDDHDVVVLGVYQDEEGMNVASMKVDDVDVVVIDVDGDMEFDYLYADVNNDGQVQDDEIVDISGQNLTVDSLGGYTDAPAGNMYADNNDIDYSNDAIV